ncbi:tetratricopeptide repeat protein 1 [Aplysia californica]|uniref:Tetratricopeptide repeat protein 1 n=1 Tax=Aplysia californica TaxID=6500 RepID=A0ABM1AAN6_APLCA|nr:tetratricopeptide repeat protein 1 [Aplysia californica]
MADNSEQNVGHGQETTLNEVPDQLDRLCSLKEADISENNSAVNGATTKEDCDADPTGLSETKPQDSLLGQKTVSPKKSDLETSPAKSDSKCTNESGVSTNSDEEFHSADEGSDSEEDSQPVPVCDDAHENNAGDFIPPNMDDDDDESEDGDEEKKEQSETEVTEELEARKRLEEALTAEEVEERKCNGQHLKEEGNNKFRNGEYDEAIESYTEALSICPLSFLKERSIMFSNRAACKMKKELYDSAIADSSSALELHPHYLKALLRRAELYEKTEKLDEALKDYQQVLELDPSQHAARASCVKLAEQIKDRNEKMKDEMMGKLKDLGNLVLRPFGLSVNNFQMQQDPNTGSYSVQFQQSPPNNGS